jgi:long-chain acyl-CoA synthetase
MAKEIIRQNPNSNGLLEPEIKTLYEVFRNGVKLSENSPCLGTRSGDSYVWSTYKEVEKRMEKFGSGLLELSPKSKNIGLYSINRPEWLIAEGGCNYYSLCTVPIYDTLGADVLSFVVNHAELSVIVCSADKIGAILALKDSPVKLIISMDKITDESMKSKAKEKGMEIREMSEVEEIGGAKLLPHRPPKPEDICTICYTSGTTGNPKGAMIKHINFPSVANSLANHNSSFGVNDCYISYLPLSHCFERCAVTAMFLVGARIGFYSGNVLKLVEDLSILKPTFFCSVPRLFNRIYEKIKGGTINASGIKGVLFRNALAAKQANFDKTGDVHHWLWDSILFSKVAAILGGKIRFMLSGSAPLSPDVLNFLRLCFSCPFVQGYGQTENAAGSVVVLPSDRTLGSVGVPLSCNEIKLVDVPEMIYLTSDNPPRGEVCIRGFNVMAGYYKDEEKTKEALDSTGWLHTGDIGVFNETGTLSIIDRKKNLFKLAQGEYIAPEKLEVVFSKSEYVQQIFVYGDSFEAELVAIVVPNFEKIAEWGASKGGEASSDPETVCKLPGLKEFLLEQLLKTGKEYKLQGFEMIKNLRVTHEVFSIENDLLTPTFKLKRNIAKKKYDSQLKELYVELKSKKQ